MSRKWITVFQNLQAGFLVFSEHKIRTLIRKYEIIPHRISSHTPSAETEISSSLWRNFHHWLHDDVIKWKYFPCYCPLWGESPVTGGFPSQKSVTRSLILSLMCAWTDGWANNRDVGDLRRHRAHYDVNLMCTTIDEKFVEMMTFALQCLLQELTYPPERRFNIKTVFSSYRVSRYKDKINVRLHYPYDGNAYIGHTVCLYQNAQHFWVYINSNQ